MRLPLVIACVLSLTLAAGPRDDDQRYRSSSRPLSRDESRALHMRLLDWTKSCKVRLGLLVVAGIGAGAGFLWYRYKHEDGPAGEVVETVKDPESIPPAREVPIGLFSQSEAESFDFTDENGKAPEISIFRKNRLQRTIANSFHKFMADREQDENRKQAWLKAPEGIQVSFEGVRLEKVKDKPGMVQIVVKGNGQEMPVPVLVSEQQLKDGEEVKVGPIERTDDIAGLGTSKINGQMVIQYLPEKSVLFIKEANFTLQATIGISTEDKGGFKGLAGKPVATPAPPVQKQP